MKKFLAAFLLLFAVPAGAVTVERLACVVDDRVITLSEVEERAAALRAQAPSAPTSVLMREALDDLVAEKLLEKQLEALAIDVAPSELQLAIDDVVRQNGLPSEEALRTAVERQGLSWTEYKQSLHRQLAQMKLVNLKVRSQVKISEDEVKRRYAELTAAEKGEQEVHASHILVMVASDASEELAGAALADARAFAERARSGMDFDVLAKEASQGGKASGGDLGWFRQGEMVRELELAAFALEPGQISEPVRSRFGWHVIKLEEKRSVQARPFGELAGQIREGLYREEMERQTQRFIDGLKKESTIDYLMAELAPAAASAAPTKR